MGAERREGDHPRVLVVRLEGNGGGENRGEGAGKLTNPSAERLGAWGWCAAPQRGERIGTHLTHVHELFVMELIGKENRFCGTGYA